MQGTYLGSAITRCTDFGFPREVNTMRVSLVIAFAAIVCLCAPARNSAPEEYDDQDAYDIYSHLLPSEQSKMQSRTTSATRNQCFCSGGSRLTSLMNLSVQRPSEPSSRITTGTTSTNTTRIRRDHQGHCCGFQSAKNLGDSFHGESVQQLVRAWLLRSS
jgi:hypothetical protein